MSAKYVSKAKLEFCSKSVKCFSKEKKIEIRGAVSARIKFRLKLIIRGNKLESTGTLIKRKLFSVEYLLKEVNNAESALFNLKMKIKK